jgi:hypothetical protein
MRMGERSQRSSYAAAVFGPVLTICPFFIVLFWAAMARPVEPVVPRPRVDREQADRALRSLLRRERRNELSARQQALLRVWMGTGQLDIRRARTGQDSPELASAQRTLRRTCAELKTEIGVPATLAVGDVIAARLVRALMRLETEPIAARREAEAVGGRFLERALHAGLVTRRGRLAAHPIVPAVVAKTGFRLECAFAAEDDLTPIELAALDEFRIEFAQGAPVAMETYAAARFGQHDSAYPVASAQAAFLTRRGEVAAAIGILEDAASQDPANRTLRNNLRYLMARADQ